MKPIETESTAAACGATPADRMIIAPILLRNLQRAAQVRSGVTMASVLPLMMLGGLLFGEVGGVIGLFGGALAVERLMTRFYCRHAVRCPHCGASLWQCGTGNFKPRRMRLRRDAHACRHCGAAIR